MVFAKFQEQMDRVGGLRFRPVSLQTHWEALGALEEDDLARAITWGQRRWSEFPSPLEVQEALEQSRPTARGRDEVRREPCPLCRDTGWEDVERQGQSTVQRCMCWATNPVLVQRRTREAQQAARRQARSKASA
jgi:hypothetical protein